MSSCPFATTTDNRQSMTVKDAVLDAARQAVEKVHDAIGYPAAEPPRGSWVPPWLSRRHTYGNLRPLRDRCAAGRSLRYDCNWRRRRNGRFDVEQQSVRQATVAGRVGGEADDFGDGATCVRTLAGCACRHAVNVPTSTCLIAATDVPICAGC